MTCTVPIGLVDDRKQLQGLLPPRATASAVAAVNTISRSMATAKPTLAVAGVRMSGGIADSIATIVVLTRRAVGERGDTGMIDEVVPPWPGKIR